MFISKDVNPYYNYKGSRVKIINSDTLEEIYDGKILDYDNRSQIIYINRVKQFNKCKVRIITDVGVAQFDGNFRNGRNHDEISIALFNGNEKEERVAKRYDLNAFGQIKTVIIDNQEVDLRQILDCEVLNISETGVLVRCKRPCFDLNMTFRLEISMRDTITKMKCFVVRLREHEQDINEYGCRFI